MWQNNGLEFEKSSFKRTKGISTFNFFRWKPIKNYASKICNLNIKVPLLYLSKIWASCNNTRQDIELQFNENCFKFIEMLPQRNENSVSDLLESHCHMLIFELFNSEALLEGHTHSCQTKRKSAPFSKKLQKYFCRFCTIEAKTKADMLVSFFSLSKNLVNQMPFC